MNSKSHMKMPRPRRGPRARGSALVYGLVIMTAVAIILSSILTFITGQIKYALKVHGREEAIQIAESGIHFYRWYLAHAVEGRTAQQIQTFWTSGSPYGVASPYEIEYKDPAGAGIGKYKLEVTPPPSGSTIVIVKSTGWTYRYPDDKRVLEVRLRRPSWSESAVLANDFTRFGEGTETFGRVHSNEGIRFDGVAHNLVTSSVSAFDDPDHGGGNEFGVHTHDSPVDPLPPAAVPARADIFEAGRFFPRSTVDFNGVLGDLSLMKTQAQSGGGRYFTGTGANNNGTHIQLQADGNFRARQVRTITNGNNIASGGSAYNGNWQTYSIPNDGVIFVEDNVWVEGTINNKRVTIVAANLSSGPTPSVYIFNDIRYTNYTGTDIIGIIGQNNVEIAHESEEDLRIDAALIAQQGRVGREHYIDEDDISSDSRDRITIFGAIATNQRYGFAWTDGTGYQERDLYYDNNLLYYPPPYFPTGTQYEMDLWEEK